jgi:hypothetical protein
MIRKRSLWYRRAGPALAVLATSTLGGGAVRNSTAAATLMFDARQMVSSNWAGYVVTGADVDSFTSVTGSWTQPAVSPSAADGYSSFWVGLGGASQQSQALEQIGASSDVVDGESRYYAWYELVPAPETQVRLAVHPGDQMTGTVALNGSDVTLSLSDQTTGGSFTKTLPISNPDGSSAEWIAEAPSVRDETGDFQIQPLADFGTVRFENASATAGGHTGSISDPHWSAQEVRLSPAAKTGYARAGVGPGAGQDAGGASPTDLSSDGSSFSVSYTQNGGGSQPSDSGGGLVSRRALFKVERTIAGGQARPG